METIKKIMIFWFVLPLWLIYGCSNNGSNVKTTGPLGKLPAVVDEYSKKIEKNETELKEVRDINKAFALGKEQEALKEEQVKKFEETFREMKTPVSIEFTQPSEQKDYTVKSVIAKEVHSRSNVVFEIETQINIDVPATGWGPEFVCIFMDDKNQVIGKEWYFWLQPDRQKGVKKGDIIKSKTAGPIDGRYAEVAKVEVKLMEQK